MSGSPSARQSGSISPVGLAGSGDRGVSLTSSTGLSWTTGSGSLEEDAVLVLGTAIGGFAGHLDFACGHGSRSPDAEAFATASLGKAMFSELPNDRLRLVHRLIGVDAISVLPVRSLISSGASFPTRNVSA